MQPCLRGQAFYIRYADDLVMGFTQESDARRMLEVLPKRLAKFGLAIHPTKTRLVPFVRPPLRGRSTKNQPGAFDFLGFTHYWGRSRKGNWTVKQLTSASRFRRAVKAMTTWCHQHRHWSIPEQYAILCQKLRGPH